MKKGRIAFFFTLGAIAGLAAWHFTEDFVSTFSIALSFIILGNWLIYIGK